MNDNNNTSASLTGPNMESQPADDDYWVTNWGMREKAACGQTVDCYLVLPV